MYMNQYNLEKLVIKTYKLVKETIFDSKKHKRAVVKTVIALCDAAGVEYEEDYFTENIEKIFDDITKDGCYKLNSPEYNPKQLFL